MPVTTQQLRLNDTLTANYRDFRIQLWPDCIAECDGEIAEILADTVSWVVFMALSEGEPVGFLEVRLRDSAEGATTSPVPFIEGWFVLPDYRKRGFGRALVQAAEDWALSRGHTEIASDTQIDNAASIEAHQRLGYHEVERLVCFLKPLSGSVNERS